MPACKLFLVYLATFFMTGTLANYTSKISKDDQKSKSKQLHGCRSQVSKIFDCRTGKARLTLRCSDVIIPVTMSALKSSLTSILPVTKQW